MDKNQPEYYAYEATNQVTNYKSSPADFSQFDEQQNSMPFIHMYHTMRQVPMRLAGS